MLPPNERTARSAAPADGPHTSTPSRLSVDPMIPGRNTTKSRS